MHSFLVCLWPPMVVCSFIALRSISCLIIISILVSFMPDFQCVEGCSRIFSSNVHLTRHKKACHSVQTLRQKALTLRREKGLGALSTLTDRKQRLQVSVVLHQCRVCFSSLFLGLFRHRSIPHQPTLLP